MSERVNEIRSKFKQDLHSGRTMQFPGAYNAMVAILIEENNFDGVYCSGAVASNSLGNPDIGLTTLQDLLNFAEPIVKNTNLPVVSDIDTGFQDIEQTIHEFEKIGVAGIHMEDQVDAKLCGHLEGKQLIEPKEMVKKVRAAVLSKVDDNFQIIARTDAKSVEGIEAAIDRAKAYVDAGADAIFPEALHNEKEMEKFRKAINVPLLSNMTEFGKTRLLSLSEIQNLGYNMVIYPVTMQRLAMMAVELGLQNIKEKGTQIDLVNKMQTRKRLYEVLQYDYYKKEGRTSDHSK